MKNFFKNIKYLFVLLFKTDLEKRYNERFSLNGEKLISNLNSSKVKLRLYGDPLIGREQ